MLAAQQRQQLPFLRLEERQAAWRIPNETEPGGALSLTVNRLPEVVPLPTHWIELASQGEELFAAFSLVYRTYLRTGLVHPNPFHMRVTPYHLLPSTDVIVAKAPERSNVVCTLSLVADGKLGLPIESAFAEEVAERRRRGVRLAEVTSLADQRDVDEAEPSPLLKVMGFMAQRAKRRGIDELLITVHPHHMKFYQRFIGFELLGEERPYGSVLDKPAVALSLDLNLLHVNHPRAYDRFFGKPFSATALSDQSLQCGVRAKMRRIVAACNATYLQPLALAEVA